MTQRTDNTDYRRLRIIAAGVQLLCQAIEFVREDWRDEDRALAYQIHAEYMAAIQQHLRQREQDIAQNTLKL